MPRIVALAVAVLALPAAEVALFPAAVALFPAAVSLPAALVSGFTPTILKPVTQDKQYIRSGQNTMKTGTQRSFAVTGDRYVGDPHDLLSFSK